ncbi:hypothetical protein HYS47_04335 [Candidatus Woesearchaeota archaeon]|nr:hypothetical protein [Candidatus Woesearchaeota archaeon]
MKKKIQADFIFFVIVVLLFSTLFVTGCLQLDEEKIKRQPTYELTKQDVLFKDSWTSEDISVFSIGLGDSITEVIEKFGLPDLRTDYPGGSTNFEYRDSLMVNNTALLIHFDNETVTRMTMRPSFNRFLQGNTKIGHSKKALFQHFGNPDQTQLLSYFTVYKYDDIGLEFHIRGQKQIGMSFYPPIPDTE